VTDETPHDAQTGEILETTAVARAANGDVIPGPTRTAGNLIDMLEDGGLSADFYEQLKKLGRDMEMHSNQTQAKCKGKVTLTLDLERDGEAFQIRGNVKVKAPELPRRRSIAWQTESGDFSRFPPNQTQMFGAGNLRRV
jgi:hypothetical protein